jgi:hypothetical protein
MSATGVIGFPSPVEPHKRVVYDTKIRPFHSVCG